MTSAAAISGAAPASDTASGAARPELGSVAVPLDDRFRSLQLGLFTLGGVLMPLGLVAIFMGWYGAAHAKYSYDQFPYLISGGVLGLGFTLVGGFLYFGAWIAKIGSDQRDASRQVAEALLYVADVVATQARRDPTIDASTDAGAVSVRAGKGTTVHRRDCALVAQREDLRVLAGDESGFTTCRVCRPTWDGVPGRPRSSASKVSASL